MELAEVVQKFKAVSLDDLGAVKLLNRTDTKYFFSVRELPEVLAPMVSLYDILEIDGKRAFSYLTLYFDTPENRLYMMHHNGQANRFKVRMRKYVDSNLTFLEVKKKTQKGRTVKRRRLGFNLYEIVTTPEHHYLKLNVFAPAVERGDSGEIITSLYFIIP